MKKNLLLAFVLVCLAQNLKAVLISDFGDVSFTIDSGTTSFTTNQTSTVTDAAGSDDNVFAGTFATTFDATGYTNFFLNAKVTGTNPGSSFSVDFYDASFTETRSYTAFLSDFGTGSYVSVALTFVSETSSFNDFAGFQFTGGGSGSNSLAISFSNVSATTIPEPSTWLLLSSGLTTVVILHHRRRK